MIALCNLCHSHFHRRLSLHDEGAREHFHRQASISEDLNAALGHLQGVHTEGGLLPNHVPTGFHKLDDMVGGLAPGTLTILAGRPGMGLTSLTLTIARNAALHPETFASTVFVSTQHNQEELSRHLCCAEAQVPIDEARRGGLSDEDWPRLAHATGVLFNAPLSLLSLGPSSIDLIASEVSAEVRAVNGQLLIIDGIDLIRTPTLKTDWRDRQVEEILTRLKELAFELQIPVLATSKLSDSTERRGGDRRPILTDGYDSTAKVADQLVFLHRAERYGITTDEHGNSTEGLAELIVSNQSQGPIGTVQIAYVNRYRRFENLQYQASGYKSNPQPPGGDAPF